MDWARACCRWESERMAMAGLPNERNMVGCGCATEAAQRETKAAGPGQ